MISRSKTEKREAAANNAKGLGSHSIFNKEKNRGFSLNEILFLGALTATGITAFYFHYTGNESKVMNNLFIVGLVGYYSRLLVQKDLEETHAQVAHPNP